MSAPWITMGVLGFLAFLAGCRADSPYHVKDAKRVYRRAALLKDADPHTFTVPR